MKDPKSVLITGASSGIGRALAEAYARNGCVLHLTGRSRARLEPVATSCRGLGAQVACHEIDVTDRAAMDGLFAAIDAPDLTIANAGVSASTSGAGNREETDRAVLRTNIDGVVNTVYPAIAALKRRPKNARRPRGQIAIIASLATFNGYPGVAAYCASKAAVRSLGEALRAERFKDGIEISVVCPGFVRSGITDQNDFRMPFFMEGGRAARKIQRGLVRNRARIAFPWPLYYLTRLSGALPSRVRDSIVRRMKN